MAQAVNTARSSRRKASSATRGPASDALPLVARQRRLQRRQGGEARRHAFGQRVGRLGRHPGERLGPQVLTVLFAKPGFPPEALARLTEGGAKVVRNPAEVARWAPIVSRMGLAN